MAFKLVFCIAAMAIACAQAKPGGPAAYSISAPSVDHASVGNTQEHTVKGHYGQSSQSDYASQVQTAHSQSHVQRSSISNDGGLAPAHGYAAPSLIGHGIGLAAPAAYAAPAYAAPAYTTHLAAAPVLKAAVAAPALVHTSVSGHGIHYGY
ncbi:pupal cuticle protein C1B isoform X2 [Drosophila sulfurigaster albostrigata]|uniref:Pupal cuticle protein C1B isoform X2 n=1 Tax=Drosophila albomicans TaxID=7291 RepID=A0A6P8ZAW3_DROAB|nr:pupal cuticle protein C1B isoform X2 [Drosophila albomicans]XP_060662859.1 pupal cuticle protein C1B isoform X2 [Drosophila nasuta]XP_062140843.1 pupal cuticle protein C1B isoform X2 [Drosophila sulfurigaster albostrigata]